MLVTLHPFGPQARPRYWNQPDEVQFATNENFPESQLEAQKLSNTAVQFYLSGMTKEALDFAYKSLAIVRALPNLVNTAIILEQMGNFSEAFNLTTEAWELDRNNRNATILYSQALLRLGLWAEGWLLYIRECAEWPEFRSVLPEWDGIQDLANKRVLVLEGGAYGDNLYFMRWLGQLEEMGAYVTYVAQPSFCSLIRSQGFRALENYSGNIDCKPNQFDYLTSILALPGRLAKATGNYSVKWTGPYIKFPEFTPKPIPEVRPLRVGICTLAGETSSQLHVRSMHDSQLQRVLSSLNQRHLWVNLTYAHGLPQTVEHPTLDDWEKTARAVSTCDLVVTVDTGVAHLAGAMGVPTWVILPGASAWQYHLGSEYHPYYGTMRLFRSDKEGLDSSVEAICASLSRL